MQRLADLPRLGATALLALFWFASAWGLPAWILPAWGQEPLVVTSIPLELNPEAPAERRLGALEYLGGLVLAGQGGGFGGYSGLSVDADGAGLWAISDRGHWLRLDFTRDAAGLPTGVAAAAIAPLLSATGPPLTGNVADAEGLRRDHDGSFLVSFERAHRVRRYASPLARAQPVPIPRSTQQLPANGGLESIAVLPDGRLVLIGEEALPPEAGGRTGVSPLWIGRESAWRQLGWPQHQNFRPTDAVALPDGGLLVLERDFRWLSGWAARLSRVSAGALEAREGALLAPELLAEWARPYANDNLEALDLRLGPDGSPWLYLMSDDNHSPFQRSLLMIFRLPENR